MPKYHPSPELLAEYAAGSLQLSRALCVAAHLEFCESCLQQVGKLNNLGAVIFSAQQPKLGASDTEELKRRVLAELKDTPVENANTISTASNRLSLNIDNYRVPQSLVQFVKQDYRELAWTALSTSIKLATLLNDKDGSQVMLSRVKPGGKMLHHRHTGEEFTVVLEGSFSDESGIFRKGDFVRRDKRHRHKPVVTKDAECICLMVLDAPIQFTGFFSRLLNPIVRRYHAGT